MVIASKVTDRRLVDRKKRLKDAKRLAAVAKAENDKLKKAMLDDANPKLGDGARVFMENDAVMNRLMQGADTAQGAIDITVLAAHKSTEKETIEAIARVYAYWILSGTDARINKIALRAARQRTRINSKTTKLHLLVEAMISHAENDRRLNSQLWNRDVQAIRWLHSQMISPTEVAHLCREAGEGINTWARRWGTSQCGNHTPVSPNAKPGDDSRAPEQPDHETPATLNPQADEACATKPVDNPPVEQPDVEIEWRNHRTQETKTFRINPLSEASAEELREIELMLHVMDSSHS